MHTCPFAAEFPNAAGEYKPQKLHSKSLVEVSSLLSNLSLSLLIYLIVLIVVLWKKISFFQSGFSFFLKDVFWGLLGNGVCIVDCVNHWVSLLFFFFFLLSLHPSTSLVAMKKFCSELNSKIAISNSLF